jgi:hypothetical protein
MLELHKLYWGQMQQAAVISHARQHLFMFFDRYGPVFIYKVRGQSVYCGLVR